jgi:hypothetical protein
MTTRTFHISNLRPLVSVLIWAFPPTDLGLEGGIANRKRWKNTEL